MRTVMLVYLFIDLFLCQTPTRLTQWVASNQNRSQSNVAQHSSYSNITSVWRTNSNLSFAR
jgi:hypothetical protein